MFDIKSRVSVEYDDKKIVMYSTEVPNQEAVFALRLMEQFAVVSAKPEGEDSAGRTTLRLLGPKEVVDRAFDIAHAAFARMERDGLYARVPDLNEVNAERDAKAEAA